MSGFGDYLSWEYVIPAFGCALAYGWFIYRGVQVKRAGGLAAHSRAHHLEEPIQVAFCGHREEGHKAHKADAVGLGEWSDPAHREPG
jgi:hypothetical protein